MPEIGVEVLRMFIENLREKGLLVFVEQVISFICKIFCLFCIIVIDQESETYFLRIHATFEALKERAEEMSFHMPCKHNEVCFPIIIRLGCITVSVCLSRNI